MVKDIPDHPLQHVTVLEAQIFRIVGTLFPPIVPLQWDIVKFSSPRAVIDEHLRNERGSVAYFKEPKPEVVVLYLGERVCPAKPLMKYPTS